MIFCHCQKKQAHRRMTRLSDKVTLLCANVVFTFRRLMKVKEGSNHRSGGIFCHCQKVTYQTGQAVKQEVTRQSNKSVIFCHCQKVHSQHNLNEISQKASQSSENFTFVKAGDGSRVAGWCCQLQECVLKNVTCHERSQRNEIAMSFSDLLSLPEDDLPKQGKRNQSIIQPSSSTTTRTFLYTCGRMFSTRQAETVV